MVVAVGLAVVPARRVSKGNLLHKARLFQKTERIVNRRVAYRWQERASLLENLARSRMMIAIVYDLKHYLPLRSEPRRLRVHGFGFVTLFGSHRQDLE